MNDMSNIDRLARINYHNRTARHNERAAVRTENSERANRLLEQAREHIIAVFYLETYDFDNYLPLAVNPTIPE